MLLLWFSGCAAPTPLLASDEPFPERLSELVDPEDPDLISYRPRWPLWSDGLDKQRQIHVPGRISPGERWAFPEGTLLLKTFSSEGRPVETRALRRLEDGWDYAAWLWDGSDAELLPMNEGVPVEGLEHTVPSRFQCRVCHEAGGGVLGFSALQLARPEDHRRLFTETPDPEPIEGHDPLTTEVLGYFVGNCVHCHDGSAGPLNAFDLRPEAALDNIVDRPVEGSVSASGIRVVPGAPEESILFLAISGEHDDPELRSMPPLGVGRRDAQAIEQIREWIRGLL